jgi:hypothetical protein
MEREDLIAICERARVPQERWNNRDSAAAQRQLGAAWALLSAGCSFEIMIEGHTVRHARHMVSDAETLWVAITFHGFDYFENGHGAESVSTFYLPTSGRLDRRAGSDWY